MTPRTLFASLGRRAAPAKSPIHSTQEERRLTTRSNLRANLANWRALAAIASLAAVQLASADLTTNEAVAADFSKVGNPDLFALYKTTVLSADASQPHSPAKVRFEISKASVGQYADVVPANWSAYHMATMKLTNHESRGVNIRFIVQIRENLDDYTGAFNGGLYLRPGETKRFVFHLNYPNPKTFGFKVMPAPIEDAFQNVFSGSSRDLSKVYHWRLSYQDSLPATVTLSDFKLLTWDLAFQGLSDRYGQFSGRFWADKIITDDDFAARKAVEEADLLARPVTGEPYGTSQLPSFESSGRWRVGRAASGNAYFITPEGRPFWSLGVNAVHSAPLTVVEGRLGYFEELPSESGRFGNMYATTSTMYGTRKCYNFHRQNMVHKYGDSYSMPWGTTVKRRLPSWGFNTFGMQSESQFMDGQYPYTLLLKTTGFTKRLSTRFTQWGTLPDPYDTSFQTWCVTEFNKTLPSHNGKWGFMGVFVDNELSWGDTQSLERQYNVTIGALNAPSTQAAKLAFLRYLSKKYRTISALNRAWGTKFSSWDAMKTLKGFYPTTMSTSMRTDFNWYQKDFASNYYGKVKNALLMSGSTALYLGSRYAMHTPEIIAGATPFVDVHSFNVYRFVGTAPWDYLDSLSKPVLISEFCITVQDRGTFGGPVETSSHEERNVEIRKWLDMAVTRRNVLGAHWFCFYDEPITGRYTDGENLGMGLVDVADTPYYGTVNVFRAVAESLYFKRG